MRHKYETRGIVLARSPLGEMSTFVTVVTPALGVLRARAQGVRRPGAKLSHALTTFAESSLVLVRGREGWRVAGAVLEENWFMRMQTEGARARAARVGGLLLRLVAGEAHDSALYPIVAGFFNALTQLPAEVHEPAEVLAALRILAALGLDAGSIPGEVSVFTPSVLADIAGSRTSYVARINHGLEVSGL